MENEMIYKGYMDSPMGLLEIWATQKGLRRVERCEKRAESNENDLVRRCREELSEYFAGRRKSFDLPLDPVGTDYQKRVWKVLETIPYGKTMTYGEVAARAGNPKGSRAAGGAAHNNRILIIIPCHRVIGKNRTLTGFGAGLDNKEILLRLEGKRISDSGRGLAENKIE